MNLKKIMDNFKNKFNGSLSDRIDLLRLFLTFLFIFASMGLVVRSFFAKKNDYVQIKLHSIYDRNGILMAYNVIQYKIVIDPSLVTNTQILWEKIKHIDVPKDKYVQAIKEKKKFVLATNLKYEDVVDIKDPSISLIKFEKRKYPLKKYFTTVGVSDLQKGIIKGIEVLAKDQTVETTIDLRIQNILANTLEFGVKEHQAQMNFGVIVNMNGEIVAMHGTNCSSSEDVKDFFNNILYGVFEYGSTCKIFTALAGFYYGVFNLNTIFDTDEGKYIFGKVKHDFESIDRFSNLETIISKSSNRGTVAAARKIGRKLVDFFKLIKLDESVDLGFTKTSKPKFFSSYKDDEIAGMSYGYNFTTNAFNILRGFLMIFNGGKIVNPTLIKNDNRNRLITFIKEKNNMYKDIIFLMRKTADRHPKLKKLECASKSGTADRIVGKSYDNQKINTFYVCAVPGPNGEFKYLMLIGMIDPKDPMKGGWNNRELAVKIAERIYSL